MRVELLPALAVAVVCYCNTSLCGERLGVVSVRAISLEGKPVRGVPVVLNCGGRGRMTSTATAKTGPAGTCRLTYPLDVRTSRRVEIGSAPDESLAPFAIRKPHASMPGRVQADVVTVLFAQATASMSGTVRSEDGKPVAVF